jgi:predicted ATPase
MTHALLFETVVHSLRRDVEQQRERAAEAIALSEAHGFPFWRAALAAAQSGLSVSAQTGQPFFDSVLHQLNARILLAGGGPPAPAEAALRRALRVARTQGAKFVELRAATSLARLWRDQGRVGKAHDLLAPLYGWFTEGFGAADLAEAKALLDTLG